MGGPDVYHWGAQLIFLYTLMDFFFFLWGPCPPPMDYVAPPLAIAIVALAIDANHLALAVVNGFARAITVAWSS